MEGGVIVFDEDLARLVGIAYSLYLLDCEARCVNENSRKSVEDFTEYTADKIEAVRHLKGLDQK